MNISIVIPVYNEEKNIFPLYQEISKVMEKVTRDYEIIFANDGSTDATQIEIEKLFKKTPRRVRSIQLTHQSGKAAVLHAGFQMAKGKVIITLDGDLQDDPREIPSLLKKLNSGYDMVSGWKKNRLDSFLKNNTSKIFNAATNLISNVKLHDHNCGFKVYRAEVVKELDLYGELHRYIPVLLSAKGYRVTEIAVNHRKRLTGKSKYGPLRFIHGFLDLITVLFITKFVMRPLHLFGYLGLIFFFLGFLGGVYLTILKLVFHQNIGTHPLLLLSVLLIIIGVQIGITGIVAEQVAVMMNKSNRSYSVKRIM